MRDPLQHNITAHSAAVIMTCFNRKEKTLDCLEAVFASEVPSGLSVDVFLVDDGCTDGTPDAVKEKFPSVTVIQGCGNLFWNRGMVKAWQVASEQSPDFFVWLNDDTFLFKDSIGRMYQQYLEMQGAHNGQLVVVGATRDSTGKLSYGGIIRKSKFKPVTFSKLNVDSKPQFCETLNGNLVLVPREVFNQHGMLDEAYEHGMGDFDYGLRLYQNGVKIVTLSGFIGICDDDHNVEGSYKDTSLPLSVRLNKMKSPLGLPIKDWHLFCRRHAGGFWFIFFVAILQVSRNVYFEKTCISKNLY